MSVPIRGVCVVVRRDALERVLPDGESTFVIDPDDHDFFFVCSDERLVCIGCNSHHYAVDVLQFLESSGLRERDRTGGDFVMIDERGRPATECRWLEFSRTTIDGAVMRRDACGEEATAARRQPTAMRTLADGSQPRAADEHSSAP